MTAYAQVKPLAQKQKRDRERQLGERKNNKTIAVVRSVERELKRNAGKKNQAAPEWSGFRLLTPKREPPPRLYLLSFLPRPLSLSLSFAWA